MTQENRPYDVVPYDPAWPMQFQNEAEIMRKLLGDEVVDIHHMGSTAIPGMSAKPYIDVLVVVKDIEKIKEFYRKMTEEGYAPKGNYTGIGEELFVVEQNGSWVRNIHVLDKSNPKVDAILDFRDYLRSHKKEAETYENLKVELKKKYPDDYVEYKKQKDVFIKELLRKIKAWKQATSSEIKSEVKRR